MGMVGGGSDAFIGAIHRLAALMDNQIDLVCGCFSVDPEISKESGKLYFLPEDRVYETYQEMFEKESQLPEGERMDFVSIVTPNFVHFDPPMLPAFPERFGSVRQLAWGFPVSSNFDESHPCGYSTYTLRILPNSPSATICLACFTAGYPE